MPNVLHSQPLECENLFGFRLLGFSWKDCPLKIWHIVMGSLYTSYRENNHSVTEKLLIMKKSLVEPNRTNPLQAMVD